MDMSTPEILSITLSEIEAAINHFRAAQPSARDSMRLCSQASTLAEYYALMIYRRQSMLPLDSLPENALALIEEFRSHHAR